jgi:SET domain-containing protein
MAVNDESGFCISYSVRDTPDKGRGVFVEEPIREGTILWRHVRGQYAVYDERLLRELVAKWSRSEVVYELMHLFGLPEFPGFVIRVFDDGVLINHSREPTVALNNRGGAARILYDASARDVHAVEDALLDDRFALIATRDLAVGEELTHDYTIDVEDPPYYDTLCEQYGVSWPWL